MATWFYKYNLESMWTTLFINTTLDVKTRPKSTRILSALGRSPHGFVPMAAHTTPKCLLATQGVSPLIAQVSPLCFVDMGSLNPPALGPQRPRCAHRSRGTRQGSALIPTETTRPALPQGESI